MNKTNRLPPLLLICAIASLVSLVWSVWLCTNLYFSFFWGRAIFFLVSLLVGSWLGIGGVNISKSKLPSRPIGGFILCAIIVGSCLEAITVRHIEAFFTGALGSLRVCVIVIGIILVTNLIGGFGRWHPAKTTYRSFVGSMLFASGAALGLARAAIDSTSINLFPLSIAVRLGVDLPAQGGAIGGLSAAFIVLGISIGAITEGLSRGEI